MLRNIPHRIGPDGLDQVRAGIQLALRLAFPDLKIAKFTPKPISFRVFTEQADAKGVEGVDMDLQPLRCAQQISTLNPFEHFVGGFVREGNREGSVRWSHVMVSDQMCDSVGDYIGFAGARSRYNEQRTSPCGMQLLVASHLVLVRISIVHTSLKCILVNVILT